MSLTPPQKQLFFLLMVPFFSGQDSKVSGSQHFYSMSKNFSVSFVMSCASNADFHRFTGERVSRRLSVDLRCLVNVAFSRWFYPEWIIMGGKKRGWGEDGVM